MNTQTTVGRPRKKITKELLIDLYDNYKNWYTVAEQLGVSNVTVYRRLNEYGISRNYSTK